MTSEYNCVSVIKVIYCILFKKRYTLFAKSLFYKYIINSVFKLKYILIHIIHIDLIKIFHKFFFV